MDELLQSSLQRARLTWVRIAVILFAIMTGALVVGRTAGWVNFSWLEIAAATTGAACVLLVVAKSIWNFPVGIISCLAYIVFFYEGRLFAEAGLQVLFVLLAVHGWFEWVGGNRKAFHVRRVPISELTLLAGLFPLAWFGLIRLLEYVGGAAPVLDGFVAASSIFAQWLLNRRYIENWLAWIVIDQVSIFLFWSREMYLTAGLYALFIGMCAAGLMEWRQHLTRGET